MNWPHRKVVAVKSVLALPWSALHGGDGANRTTDDEVRRLGAELARAGRIRDLDVHVNGLAESLHPLNQALAEVGMALASDTSGGWALAPAEEAAPLERHLHDVTSRVLAGAIQKPEREVLDAVIAGTLDIQRLGGPRSRALATLVRAGLVARTDDDGYEVAHRPRVLIGPAEQETTHDVA